jgi:RecG-like helicase
MKFDELLAQQLSVRFAHEKRRTRRAHALPTNGALLRHFLQNLPFRLTSAKRRAVQEVLRDLAEATPMQRLLQGDVGSGKTIVAAIACLAAVDGARQAAVMRPPEFCPSSTGANSTTGSRPWESGWHGCTGGSPASRRRKRWTTSHQAGRKS